MQYFYNINSKHAYIYKFYRSCSYRMGSGVMVGLQVRSASCVDIHTQIVSYYVGRRHVNILSESLGLCHPRFNMCLVWIHMVVSYSKTEHMSYKCYSLLGSFTLLSHIATRLSEKHPITVILQKEAVVSSETLALVYHTPHY